MAKADYRDLIKQYAQNEDDRLFLSKQHDKWLQSQKGFLTWSVFMDPHQRSTLSKFMKAMNLQSYLDGGYDLAERTISIFLPDVYGTDEANLREELCHSGQYPIKIVHVSHKSNTFSQPPTHRDYLGALMNLGIKREVTGDILVHPDFAQIITLGEISEFIAMNLDQVAKCKVETRVEEVQALSVPEPKYSDKVSTVASLRLDAIVAEGYSLSRAQAAQFIEAGKVNLSFEECTEVARLVKEGALISLRGLGRIKLEKIGGNSKKDRIFITLRKYI